VGPAQRSPTTWVYFNKMVGLRCAVPPYVLRKLLCRSAGERPPVNGRRPAVTPARKKSVMFAIAITDTSWNMPLMK